jgi:hypothetical protein
MKRFVVLCGALLACTMLLGACGTLGAPTTSVNTSLMPAKVPAGWHVFHGPHFALAYPPGWTVSKNAQATGTAAHANVAYGFASPDRKQMVAVNEQDGWDAATIQREFCRQQSTPVELAGLTWRYVTAENGVLRAWLFITDRGTVYGMGAQDGTQPQSVQQQDAAVMATFRAEYTTSGCK